MTSTTVSRPTSVLSYIHIYRSALQQLQDPCLMQLCTRVQGTCDSLCPLMWLSRAVIAQKHKSLGLQVIASMLRQLLPVPADWRIWRARDSAAQMTC